MKKNLLLLFLSFAVTNSYSQGNHSLTCFTIGTPQITDFNEVGYWIDASIIEYNGCSTNPSMMIAIFDSCSCETMSDCNQNFGQTNQFYSPDCTSPNVTFYNCRPRPSYIFQFALNDPAAVNGMINLLDSTTTCDYILAYTWFTYDYSSLGAPFKNAFISLGASAINSLPDNAPYIFFAKKGNPNSVQELIGNTSTDSLMLNTTFNCATSSVNDISFLDQIGIYPNPARSGFWIKNILSNEKVTVQITDPLGKIVYTEILFGKNEHQIKQDLSSGIYLVRITSGNKSVVRKVVIEE